MTYKLDDTSKDVTLRKTTQTLGNYLTKADFVMENGNATVKYNNTNPSSPKTVYANSKTVFVVKDKDNNYKAYTGIKSIPTIKGDVGFAGYCKTTGLLTVAFLDASAANVVFDNKDVIYYTYNAVINGKITETKVMVDQNADYTVGVEDGDHNFLFRTGPLSLPSTRTARSRTSPGRVSERRTLPLLGLGRVCFRRTQKAFGTAMRLCVSLFRGVAAPLGCVIQ